MGDFPKVESSPPDSLGWHTIRSPKVSRGIWLAILVGMVLLVGLCAGLGMWSLAVGDGGGFATSRDATSPLVIALLVILLYIPLHESLHLLGQPDRGRSSRSVLILWPAKLRFGVYYEGCMSRRRWLVMRLAPFIVLSMLPVLVLALLQIQPQSPDLEVGLSVLMVVNTLGSGGDVIAAILVMTQVPPTASMCFQSGKAYWQPA